uniref:Piwi domain-containing protein n=1 Tax=Caenorhabditis japonica TaxID=281687 RepID=A0A8R1HLI5_CAEJA
MKSQQEWYQPKIDPNMRWFPRPGEKCSGDFYVEKVKLLVNWFKFSSKISDRSYYEYGVEMKMEKKFKLKNGQWKMKSTLIPIPDRPHLFWQHIRHEKRENERNGRPFREEEYVFDNRETAYSVNRHDTKITSRMVSSTNQNVTHVLELVPRREFQLYFSREDPMRDEEANRSYKFLKDVMTQKVRYSPEHNNQIAIEFTKNFVYDSNVIHAVPESFYDPDRFDYSLEIAPRIETWFGLYIAVKETSEGNPMLNMAIVDKLFVNAPSMSLLDYLLLVLDPETRNDEVRNQRKTELRRHKLTIDGSKRGQLNRYLCNIKMKCTEVWDESKMKMCERHLSYIELSNVDANQHEIKVQVGRGRDATTRKVPLSRIYEDNNKPIEFPYLPLVVVRSGSSQFSVPMEHLNVHEKPQRYKSWIDYAMKDRFIQRATRKPHVYKEKTFEMLESLGLSSEELNFVASFGFSPELKMLPCPGKVLKEPMLVNKENKKIEMTPVIRGFREKQLNVVSEKEMCCALFVLRSADDRGPCLTEKQATDFYGEIIDGCDFRGLNIGKSDKKAERSLLRGEEGGVTKFGFYGNCTLHGSVCTFQDAAQHAKRLFDNLPDKNRKSLLFIIITERESKQYGFIKFICDNDLGVPSQHVAKDTVVRVLRDLDRSHRIAYQIALKINAKLNGVNQELDWSEGSEVSPEEKERRKSMPLKMFVGIDVTHPTSNSGIDYSIASIVASINPGGTRYRTVVATQEECKPGQRPVAHGRERTDILEGKFTKLVQSFAENNQNRMPDHIVVYRDGVSDSEMLRVSHDELRSLKMEVSRCLRERGTPDSPHPKYTFIVVQKRHNTRIFRQIDEKRPSDPEASARWDTDMKESENTGIVNPNSGTTVDRVIVSKYKFDFFLSSHHGALGTSRPVHYIVMYDDFGLTKDQTYKMSYELAFLSARCRKPISIPAPVHYAHLSCEKAKEVYRAYKEHLIGQHPVANRQTIERILQPNPDYPGMPFV